MKAPGTHRVIGSAKKTKTQSRFSLGLSRHGGGRGTSHSPDALVPSWYQWPSAMFDTYVLQHFLRGLRSAFSDVAVKLINALSVWAVMTDEDHTSLVLTDRVHDAEHTRCPSNRA